MKYLFILSLLFIFNNHWCYSQFSRGFENGYKKANPIGVVPIAPIAPIGKNTYQDGYGMGYSRGSADYKSAKRQNNLIPKYERYENTSIDAMGKMLQKKQRRENNSRNKKPQTYYNRQAAPRTIFRNSPDPIYNYTPNSYAKIKQSSCIVYFKSNKNYVAFTTSDNREYELWYKGKKIAEFSKYSKYEAKNFRPGVYNFQVYYFDGRRKKRLPFSPGTTKTWNNIDAYKFKVINMRLTH